MKKLIAMALAATGCALATGAAQAGNVYWSVGINLPPVGTVVSNVPVYSEPAPVYYQEPVYYPAPVYVPAPRVIYRPAPVVYAPPVYYGPAPVVYRAGYYPQYYHHHHHDGEWRDRDGRRDEYGSPYREGRWVPPADPRRQRHDR